MKNVSALLAQEIKGNLCAWQTTTQNVRKDEEGYYDRWIPSHPPCPAFHSTHRSTPRVSSLAWACLRLTPLPFSGTLQIRSSWHPNLENIPGPFLSHVSSSPLISVSKLGLFCHLHQTGPFPRPKKLSYPISGRDDKAPCPPTEAFPSQGSVAGLGQRPPLCQRQKRV